MPYNQSTKAKIFFSGDRQVMIPRTQREVNVVQFLRPTRWCPQDS